MIRSAVSALLLVAFPWRALKLARDAEDTLARAMRAGEDATAIYEAAVDLMEDARACAEEWTAR